MNRNRLVLAVCVLCGFASYSFHYESENAVVAQEAIDDVAAGRKSITVFARNAATASSKASAQNPGWTVVSVKKVNNDPKSMAYRVVLKK